MIHFEKKQWSAAALSSHLQPQQQQRSVRPSSFQGVAYAPQDFLYKKNNPTVEQSL